MWTGAAIMLAVVVVAGNMPIGKPIETKPAAKPPSISNAQNDSSGVGGKPFDVIRQSDCDNIARWAFPECLSFEANEIERRAVVEQSRANRIAFFSTWLALIGVMATAYFSWRNTKAAEKSARAAIDTAEATQKLIAASAPAFVISTLEAHITDLPAAETVHNGLRIEISIQWQNCGERVAIGVANSASLLSKPFDSQDTLQQMDSRGAFPVSVQPKDETQSLKLSVYGVRVVDFCDNKISVYLLSLVQYRDRLDPTKVLREAAAFQLAGLPLQEEGPYHQRLMLIPLPPERLELASIS